MGNALLFIFLAMSAVPVTVPDVFKYAFPDEREAAARIITRQTDKFPELKVSEAIMEAACVQLLI